MTLDTARTALGATASLLDTVRAEHDPDLVATAERLREALRAKQYEAHDAAIAFDAAFGGLRVPTEAGDDWRDEGMYILIGAFACVTSEAHTRPAGGPARTGLGLVPVAYDPSDGIMFLDRDGRAYFQDTIEDVDAEPFADDGAAAVVRLLESVAVDLDG